MVTELYCRVDRQKITFVHLSDVASCVPVQEGPNNRRLEVHLREVCLQFDSFQAECSLYARLLCASLVLCCLTGAAQAEPNTGRLEVGVEGACMQFDSFQAVSNPYVYLLCASLFAVFFTGVAKAEPNKGMLRWI